MTIHTYNKKRSIQSRILEKYLILRGTKKEFSTEKNTTKMINKKAIENTKPYLIKKGVVTSSLQEDTHEEMQVFTINDRNAPEQKVILYLHGGAWTKQPLPFHWKLMDKLAQSLDAKIIAPIYPKVPNFTYQDTYSKLLTLYKNTLSTVNSADQLTIMGDSSGGNISLGLAQLLKQNDLPQPKDIILLSAALDLSLENPLIPEYEKRDPMLSIGGVTVITKVWAGDKTLKDPLISPYHGDLQGLAKITHFVGTHEIICPDAIKLDKKLTEQGIDIQTYVYPKMNHVFVIMPLPEAQDAQQKIIAIIGS
ncbi:alpha/beta hydrolase [Paenalkalicoccus suaedae]|uniref:Alpha/beta hydrolase n=1 Tax=Paenalkalicoccus suaedae TaxID=2592382 RepID=A0A859FJ87_9BACI|nr:alpha/beta hydrolase [Paenalkalicoccus suaedae]QKS72585.1 alpha/beta hydrolase [Paenalkalicoccus suaedae]